MTLWNIIRDWFVSNIFGGTTSNENVFEHTIGDGLATSDFNFEINGIVINIGDWLSTTATIIVLCAMCFFLFLVVRWLFRLTSGLLSGRG